MDTYSSIEDSMEGIKITCPQCSTSVIFDASSEKSLKSLIAQVPQDLKCSFCQANIGTDAKSIFNAAYEYRKILNRFNECLSLHNGQIVEG